MVFDDVSSMDWDRPASRPRKKKSRVKFVVAGAAAILSAPLFMQGGFSVPFLQYIGSPASHAALNPEETAPARQVARASAPAEPDERTARTLPASTHARVAPAPRPAATRERLMQDDAAIDPRRLGRASSTSAADTIVDPARFASKPAATSDAALTVARLKEFAGQAPARDADTGERMAALTGPATDVPHPTRRPAHEAAAPQAESTNEIAELLETLPSGRPESDAARGDPVQVASIGPEPGTEAAMAAAADPNGMALPESAPVPGFRPERAAAPQAAPQTTNRAAPKPAAAPTPTRPTGTRTRGGALAYAPASGETDGATENSGGGLLGRIFGGGAKHSGLPGAGERIAVYDISAATVYMPNGEKLEAHSGLAHMQDNPRFVREKNRGPTPPNVYNLQMRENLFHGVEAVRLLPADGRKKFNRDGLLAHTYMYRGGMSQSNGCVVFKNYKRFLTAFKQGHVTRMIVVPRLAELPTYMASL